MLEKKSIIWVSVLAIHFFVKLNPPFVEPDILPSVALSNPEFLSYFISLCLFTLPVPLLPLQHLLHLAHPL